MGSQQRNARWPRSLGATRILGAFILQKRTRSTSEKLLIPLLLVTPKLKIHALGNSQLVGFNRNAERKREVSIVKIDLVKRVMITIVVSILLVVIVMSGMIAFGTAKRPAPLESISKPFEEVDFTDLPKIEMFQARDGVLLAYRKYPGATDKVAVLIHGSSSRSDDMHPLAKALHASGSTVYSLDIRGHGASGKRGDISYVGQLEDDLADFVHLIRPDYAGSTITLIGFSSGGGFALRFAGGKEGSLFDRYVLLSPALGYKSPTTRPGVGGWVAVYMPRIIALGILDSLGIHSFEGLPVLAFAIQPGKEDKLVESYSYRLQKNFGTDVDFSGDIRGVARPMSVLVGSADELFFPDEFAAVFRSSRPETSVRVIEGLGHIDMSLNRKALEAVVQTL
jgi:pimeloyl-ACP methyl ester carboxylesterase